jgi:argininosuccinate lyase
MLKKCGILLAADADLIVKGLYSMLNDYEDGSLTISDDFEDIHSFNEYELIKRIGETGKKLHTSRSRNDQVAVDMKLYAKAASLKIINLLENLLNVIEDTGNKNKCIMPGYTHMQRAQVVTFKYHLMAYYEMFNRDKKRIDNALQILNECPLGSGALAGTTFNIDRQFVSDELNFKKPTGNFMDSVSDRDYIIELLSCFSIIMVHLSRLSEELVLWSSQEFRFIAISDEFSTGSSLMPHKKNPDAPELIRGKTGRVFGSLISILTTMKGLPLSYNKDMQEDKEQFFDSYDTVSSCLSIISSVLKGMTVSKDNMLKAVKKGFLNATEVADYLVSKGIAFRDAHKITGEIVLYCEGENKAIEDISLEELNKFSQLFEEDVYEFIDYSNTLNRGIKVELK